MSLFESHALPKEHWTHEAHLAVAILFLKKYRHYDAICRLKAGIMTLNAAHGTANTAEGGYHETLTLFWISVISLFIERHPSFTEAETVNAFVHSPLANKHLPFLFYSRETVLSEMGRAHYVSPDVHPVTKETVHAVLEGKALSSAPATS